MNNSLKHIILLFLVLLVSLFSYAGKLKQDPKLVTGKLSNGLTYYIYPNDYPKGEAVFRLFIKSGSVFEEDSQQGLAHFLEHMAFNGTKNFPGNSMIRFLESNGAKFGKDLNAHTSFNETVYKLQLPTNNPGFVDSTLTILSDWADGLLLDSTEIDNERGVILSEWLSKTGPEKDVQNAFLMDILNGSRFSKRLVIGDTAVIKKFPYERIHNYYRQWYHPKLMAVAISGDVNVRTMEKLIRKKFEVINKPANDTVPVYSIPDYSEEKAKIIVHESLSKIEYNRIQLLPVLSPVNTEESFPAYLQQVILNRLMTSRLNSLSFENPPYANASIGFSSFLNTKNILLGSVNLIPNKIDSGIQTFSTHLEQMFRYGFIKLEINKVKKSYLNSLKRRLKSKSPIQSMSYMDQIYSCYYKGDKLITPKAECELAKKYIDGIDSLTLVSYLQKTVNPFKTHYLLTAFDKVSSELPSEKKLLSMASEIRNGNINPYTKVLNLPESLLEEEPKAGKVISRKDLTDIKSSEFMLSNGAKVIFRRSETKKSQLTLTGFREGGLYAVDSTDYVSGLYAGGIVSLSGAGEFSREALNHFLAGNTASVRFLIDKTRSGIAATSNISDKETLFKLLYLKWTQPRMDTSLFVQTKEKAIESYRTANKTDADRFNRDFGYIIQGRDYTNRELTDTILINEFREESLISIFNKSFGSAMDYTFILTADCDIDDLLPLVNKYIGSLPSYKPKTKYVYSGPVIPKDSIKLERKAGDSPKATVSMVFQQDKTGDSFRLFELKGDMIQDVLKIKLLNQLREKMGMVYGVSVSSGATLHPSVLSRKTVAFTCMPENAELLIDKTMEQIKLMVSDPSSFEVELNDVKTNMIKDMQLNSQRDSFWGGFIRNSIFNGETDWSYVNNFVEIVSSVTTQNIATLMKESLLETKAICAIMYPKDVLPKTSDNQ